MGLNIKTLSFRTSSSWRKLHFHDAPELIYVASGEVCAHINEEKIHLRTGDIILINSGAAHFLENIQSAKITYIQTEAESFFGFPENGKDSCFYAFVLSKSTKPYAILSGQNELAGIFSSIQKEIDEKNSCYELYVKAYVDLIAAFMRRHDIFAQPDEQTAEKIRALLPVAEFIEKNFASPITLNELASTVFLSKYELCRKFKAVTGKTTVDYINYVRLRRAKLLLKSDMSVTQTAVSCGFSSVQYFNRIFKKITAVRRLNTNQCTYNISETAGSDKHCPFFL